MAEPGESNLDDIFKQAQGPPPQEASLGPVPKIAKPGGPGLSIALPVGIFLLILVVGWFFLIPAKSYPEAGRRAAAFLLAAGHQEYPKAWGMMSDGFKKRMPFPQFESECAGNPQYWLIDEVDVKESKIGAGDRVLVRVIVTNNFQRRQSKYGVMVAVIQEAGDWKVAGMEFK